MEPIIDITALASWLDRDDILGSGRANLIVSLTNALITEAWTHPADPVPASVRVLALTVAARAWAAKPGSGRVQSITSAADDVTRTERYAVTDSAEAGDVFLTDAELARLNGATLTVGEWAGSVKYC